MAIKSREELAKLKLDKSADFLKAQIEELSKALIQTKAENAKLTSENKKLLEINKKIKDMF